MGLADINIGGSFVKDTLDGLGDFAGKIRSAITGDVSPEKKAELETLAMQLENQATLARLAIAQSEASSQDTWTSRARPSFLYVVYIFILFGIPMGILSVFSPATSTQIATGCKAWLDAIPGDMWVLFGSGYLGYSYFRTRDKTVASNERAAGKGGPQ
ncbi:MAG: 3TM-type holin [Syntrophaceae bacterium]